MWKERNHEHPNYARISYVYRQHHGRYKRYVEAHGLTCQACGGRGGWVDVICELGGPWEPCGWCEGTGTVTRWLRGLYLRTMRDEKRRAARVRSLRHVVDKGTAGHSDSSEKSTTRGPLR